MGINKVSLIYFAFGRRFELTARVQKTAHHKKETTCELQRTSPAPGCHPLPPIHIQTQTKIRERGDQLKLCPSASTRVGPRRLTSSLKNDKKINRKKEEDKVLPSLV